ncbi:uncharacterized protein ACHE_70152A [Aspergillus chevalieri]|uniref:Zn(2)-C6 fungal-type domain-containing protein n=1 Tax=Aspergillus chevalieri TaxID=182096 RepID=A0A7R7ZS36_ASPCH|nr:uncharacterized protein ACHE_70152A [Aspergillus chevalieri]BCR91309.1 hypothetical protein ACHE_70152A [Aspergillus chevalieri]
MISDSSVDKDTPRPSRQRPGSACDECRRRKLRCDRGQPKCEVCALSGVVCNFNSSRPPRGPKRGQIRAMQSRIATLERHILEQQSGLLLPADELPVTQLSNEDKDPQIPGNPEPQYRDREGEWGTPDWAGGCIPDLIRAELDQLYFDRVHVSIPILHQRRYFCMVKQATRPEGFSCLQYAMWTLAASLSAQFHQLQWLLYKYTVEKLEAIERDSGGHDCASIQQAQAWILLAVYECIQMNHQRGWISAGRSFRLVQFLRLYEIDSPESLGSSADWIEMEEKRRTFWMAYCLDRFTSFQNGFPLTLNEQVISTRVPAPELDFQSGQPVSMGFLSQVMASTDQPSLSSFAECIIMATICGRCLCHRQQSSVERIYGDMSLEFWDRHLWLDTILQQRIQVLSLQYPSTSEHVDSLILFTNLMLQAIVLYLYKIVVSVPWDTDESEALILEYKNRSSAAAQGIITFTKPLRQLTYFKICPFTAIPLFLCAEYFLTNREGDVALDSDFQDILDVLRDLKNVNNLAQMYLALFDLDCVPPTPSSS